MYKKSILLTVIFLVVGLLAFSFSGNRVSVSSAQGKPVKIGVLVAYTGFTADFTPWMEKGALFAVHEFGGKVAGRPIKLIMEDSASDPSKALDKARKMVERDKVDVIVGPILAPSAAGVAAYTAQSGTPHIIITQATLEELGHGGNNVFMHGGTLRGSGYPLGLYAYNKMGARTATVLHDDFNAGADLTQGAMDSFVSRGGKIIQRQRVPLNVMDFAPYLTAMKKADVVFFWFVPLHALRFITQYNEYGLKMPLVQTGCTTLGEGGLKQLGTKSLGLLSGHTYDAGIDTPEVKDWVKRYVQKWGHLKDSEGRFPEYAEGVSMYMSVRTALEGIKATGGDTRHEVLSKGLRNLKYKSPWGMVSFRKDGLGIGDQKILKVIKTGDRYHRTAIHSYNQIELCEPEKVKDLAPKM